MDLCLRVLQAVVHTSPVLYAPLPEEHADAVCTHAGMHARMHMNARIHARTHVHACACAHARTCTHAHVHARPRPRTPASTPAKSTRMHAGIHPSTHARTFICAHVRRSLFLLQSFRGFGLFGHICRHVSRYGCVLLSTCVGGGAVTDSRAHAAGSAACRASAAHPASWPSCHHRQVHVPAAVHCTALHCSTLQCGAGRPAVGGRAGWWWA